MGTHQPFINLGPGDSIKEDMEFYGWNQKDAAEILGISEKHLSQLINNKIRITAEMAQLLSSVFKQSPEFWLQLDAHYRLRMEKDKPNPDPAARAQIFQYMPIREMQKKGWLGKKTANIFDEVKKFWNIPVIDFAFLQKQTQSVCFRKSPAYTQFNSNFALAWLQKVKNEARKAPLEFSYNRTALEMLALKVTEFTNKENGIKEFFQVLKRAGVLFLFLPHLEKTYTDGAALWVENNPVIVYTGRLDRNDNFWFTITHEIGHVLLHEKKLKQESPFLDVLDKDGAPLTTEDQQADIFARERLRIPEILRAFSEKIRISKKQLLNFANIFNLHPGIIVGCLQYEKIISYSFFNQFKETVKDKLTQLFS
ncbi:MAG: HigA family addiction module antidote protein [Candidatus Riflebacteria bacterium]|nr:HigA family addiction module antidote protein [Candidatus Riflebacteria bacterium]